MKHWWTKWTVWEYFPWWLANVPVYGIYLWFALRARHFFFFSNVNPAIPLGGAMGESKKAILDLLPAHLKPATVFVPAGSALSDVENLMRSAGIEFPVVAKPDIGERGFLVQKFDDAESLSGHLRRYHTDFLIQEFLSHPMEATVLFHRFPDSGGFGITSVCTKEFLHVTGDGISTVRELMHRTPRSAFQAERFEREQPDLMNRAPAAGEVLLLEPIGNHARGTKFLNANDLIGPDMIAAFERVCSEIEGVHFGRFDMKCASVEALCRGEFWAMELNGVFADPAHVYDPEYGAFRAYRHYARHWRILFDLHRVQRRRGIRPASYREAFRIMQDYFRYKKRLQDGQVR